MKRVALFFETSAGKQAKNLFIGGGAAIVLMGALFKLQSWPGAGAMLTAGLTVEALIFLLQGILPPHKDYYWEKIYPGLDVSPEEEEHRSGHSKKPAKPLVEQLDDMLADANVERAMIERLGKNLEKFSGNIEKMTEVADITGSTNEYATKTKEAAAALSRLTTSYGAAADSVTGLANVTTEFKTYQEQVQNVVKNLASLNTMYEAELQGTNSNLKALNKNLSSLNNIYGNMLTAMGGNRPA